VLKKRSRKSPEVNDVPADNPVGTMERFNDGLKRVLAAGKRRTRHSNRRKQKRETH